MSPPSEWFHQDLLLVLVWWNLICPLWGPGGSWLDLCHPTGRQHGHLWGGQKDENMLKDLSFWTNLHVPICLNLRDKLTRTSRTTVVWWQTPAAAASARWDASGPIYPQTVGSLCSGSQQKGEVHKLWENNVNISYCSRDSLVLNLNDLAAFWQWNVDSRIMTKKSWGNCEKESIII